MISTSSASLTWGHFALRLKKKKNTTCGLENESKNKCEKISLFISFNSVEMDERGRNLV